MLVVWIFVKSLQVWLEFVVMFVMLCGFVGRTRPRDRCSRDGKSSLGRGLQRCGVGAAWGRSIISFGAQQSVHV